VVVVLDQPIFVFHLSIFSFLSSFHSTRST